MSETNSTGGSAQAAVDTLLHQQQQEIFVQLPAASSSNANSFPDDSLFRGDRKYYLELGVPLYKASIKCDWKAAKCILDKKPELIRYSLTENGETALHLAASVKRSKNVEMFVINLINLMEKADLELVNKNSNTALYLAAATGNIKTVRFMLEKNKMLNIIAGGGGHMMPLYAAALFGNHEVVRYLYGTSKRLYDDGWTNQSRGWLLQKCVEADMFDVALNIVKQHPQLGSGAVLMNLARKPDAFSETKSAIIKRSISSVFTMIGLKTVVFGKENEALQLLKIVWEDISKRNKREIDDILRGPPDVTNVTNQDDELALENVIQALQLKKLIDEHCHKLEAETKNIMDSASRNLGSAQQLHELSSKHLLKHIEKILRDTQKVNLRHPRKTYSSRILFIAAEMGNTIFLVELIRQYPDLLWKVNDKNHSIFHIAVKNRHEGIYNMLYEIGSMKDLITPLKDQMDNNMLHLAGKNASKDRLAGVSGPALQMQRELLWFKEVRNMMPPSLRERKNKQGQTPYELFAEEHKELVTQGEKWMKGMASQCMVVATLVATIVFAAAFTVPGGYNQNDGIPIFYRKVTFVVFVVADAISLFLSSASILTFLSLLTSRYAENDFLESLPRKLLLGLVTLFLSITAMMVTFSVSFFILYHKEMKWVPISIGAFAVTPVLLYVVLQHHLLIDVLSSSYGSKYLFKPRKQFLF